MYKALVSFTGKVSMTIGQVGDISDKAVAADLLKAGYVEEIKEAKKPEKKSEKK